MIPGRRPKAVLLDVGLTLVHPNGTAMLAALRRELPAADMDEDDVVAALILAAEARHLPYPRVGGDARVATTWGMLLGLSAGAAARVWSRTLAQPGLYDELDGDALALLAGLAARGVRLAAVSNSDGTLEAELRRFGLRDAFEVVVDSTLAGSEKPDPRIYRTACEALELPPGECWFVGDGLVNDVIGPQGAGVALGLLYDRFGLYRHLTGVARVSRLAGVFDLLDAAGEALAGSGRLAGGSGDVRR